MSGATPARRGEVKLSGPFFDPAHAERFKAHLQQGMKGHADALEAKIKAKTKVKSGDTRDSVKVTVAAAKPGKTGKAGKWIAIRAEATASRKATKGDAPRRGGTKVPYPIFQDHKNGFLTDTVQGEHGALFAALKSKALEFVAETNAASPRPASGAA